MSEVLSPTDESDTNDDVVYRNQAQALFEEPEDLTPDEQRRSRVSARFDRSSWQPEYYHRFEPSGSKYAPKNINTAYNNHNFGKGIGDSETVQGGYTKAGLQAVSMHGTYKLLEVVRTTGEKGLVVKAQCTGRGCRGQATRTFKARDWLDLEQNKSCPQCKGWLMMQEADARYRATVNPTHGAWMFESMTRLNDNKATVTGVCTGPVCGGWKRNFNFNAWQGTRMAMAGCYRCCDAERDAADAKMDAALFGAVPANGQDRGAA